MMNSNPESRHGPWVMYFTVAILSLPVWYVLSSGPMKMAFEEFGWTAETHERVYAPLVWLGEDTLAGSVVGWYWDQFPTGRWNVNRGEYHDEYDIVGREGRGGDQGIPEDSAGEWLYSSKARAISRNLGVED